MKHVDQTAAGRKISAWVVVNKKGEEVATVQAHYGDSTIVNVFSVKDGPQSQTAGGYGYDKFTSALSGLKIDGHLMTDHCSTKGAPKPPRGRKTWPQGAKPKKGYGFANFTSGGRYGVPDGEAGYMSCHRGAGFDYLRSFGYRIIRAI